MHTVRWDGRSTQISSCPVCASRGAKTRILELAVQQPASEFPRTVLLRCPDCDARYAEPLQLVKYEEVDRHGLKFYLEQGAGIRSMLEPFLLADARPVRRYLEIGCSFGFVMDYARRILGWQVRGFDPGFIAAAGRQQLRLPIENRYFTGLAPGDARADLLFCSEVIEHIAEPGTFVELLRGALEPGGLLLLTTPNGDALSPDLAPELLLPLLSPGQHVILYGPRAITFLLQRAGFEHIRIDDAGHQLRVAGSAAPFSGRSAHFSSDLYRRYLAEAAAEHDTAEPLGAGLVCRLFKEEVGRGNYADAQPLYRRLRDGYLRRFGVDIEDIKIDALPLPSGSDFSAFSEAWPCNLAGTWHARGIVRLLQDGDPERAAVFFDAAVRFGAALRSRFQAIGGDDAETALYCREAEIAQLHCLARCDPRRAVASFERLKTAQVGSEDANFAAHAERARRALFGDLVRAGHYRFAERVLGENGLEQLLQSRPEDDEMRGELQASDGFAWGVYLLDRRADYAKAAAAFGEVWRRTRNADTDKSLPWMARFHQGLACRRGGDTATAERIAAELRAAVLAMEPVPDEVRARLRELSPAAGIASRSVLNWIRGWRLS